MYAPGLSWYASDNYDTHPRAAIWASSNYGASQSSIQFGTSNDFSTGVTNTAMTIDHAGNVGIGTTTPGSPLHVNGSSSATSGMAKGTYLYLSSNPSSASTGTHAAVQAYSSWGGSVASPSGTATGLYAIGDNQASVNLGTATGVAGEGSNSTATTVTNAIGVSGTAKVQNAAGTVTNGYGGYFGTSVVSGAMTNAYGVYISNIAGTNKWGLYQADSAASNYFAGKVGIGTTTPAQPLHVHAGTGSALVRVETDGNQPAQTLYVNRGGYFYYNGPNASGHFEMSTGATADVVWNSNWTERMRLIWAANGPTLRLSGLAGGTGTAAIDLSTYTNPANPGVRILATDNNWSANLDFQTKTPGADANALNSRMYIAAGGNIGIGTTSPSVSFDISAKTDALALPKGTTAEQPGTPQAGWIRYNTSNNAVEFHNGTAWASLSSSSGFLSTSGGTLSGALTISSGGASITGGINNNSGNITNAGSITGVGANITGAGAMTVAAGGTNQNLTLSGSGTGSVILTANVGIGTTTPTAPLTIATTSDPGAKIISTNSDAMFNVDALTAGYAAGVNFSAQNGTIFRIENNGTGDLEFRQIDQSKVPVIIKGGTGYVGIGTTAPTNLLSLAMGDVDLQEYSNIATSRPELEFHRARNTQAAPTAVQSGDDLGGLNFMGYDGNSWESRARLYAITDAAVADGTVPMALIFKTSDVVGDGAERMRITSSGNVGIGTTTPAYLLDVLATGSATDGGAIAQFHGGDTPTAGNLYGISVDKGGVDSVMIGINKNTATGGVPSNSTYISTWMSNGQLAIGRGGDNSLPATSDIFINSTGKVGIGTTSPQAGLDIATTGTAGSAIIVPRDTTANTPTGVNGMIRYNTSTNVMESYQNGGWKSDTTLVKTSTVSITNNTTLADLAELQFTVGANQTWTFEFKLFFDNVGTSDNLKMALQGPSSPSTVIYNMVMMDGNAGQGVISNESADAFNVTMNASNTIGYCPATTTPCSFTLTGTLINGANAGTLKLQVAQMSMSGNATRIRAGSTLRMTRVN